MYRRYLIGHYGIITPSISSSYTNSIGLVPARSKLSQYRFCQLKIRLIERSKLILKLSVVIPQVISARRALIVTINTNKYLS